MRLTVADRLLLAADRIGKGNLRSFSAEELVVRAWEEYPETFGLRGILDDHGRPQYPDSNRVFAEIMGSKPLRRQGLLEKVGTKTYRLTEAGRQRVNELSDEEPYDIARRSVNRRLQENIRRLTRARAVSKLRRGAESSITFLDACSFWGITPRSSAMALESRLAHVGAVLQQIRNVSGPGAAVIVDRSVRLSTRDIDQLIELHGRLQREFSKELAIIRRRTDER